MKLNLLALCALLIFTFTFCSKDEIPGSPNKEITSEKILNSLISEFNDALFKQLGIATPEIKKGFLAVGSLKSTIIQGDNDKPALVFLFEESDKKGKLKKIKFDFGLDEIMEFPEFIENARVVFIGNQLIIQNLDTKEQINFFVKIGDEIFNKTPSILTVDGAYLGIQTTGAGDLSLKSGGWCSCVCSSCLHVLPCGSASCSCQSACGGGCSKTCRFNYNAVCTDTCPIE